MISNNNYDFDLIISSEELRKNREETLRLNKTKKDKKKLNLLIKLSVLFFSFLFMFLIQVNQNDMQNHIEKVSSECASQGYGITVKYTKYGDKYYACKK